MRNLKITTSLYYDDELAVSFFNRQFKKLEECKFLFTNFGSLPSKYQLGDDYNVMTIGNYKIYTNLRDYEALLGFEFRAKYYKKYFHNVFFGTPINGYFNINFDYVDNSKGSFTNFDLQSVFDNELSITRVLTDGYSLDFNYSYLFDIININLVDYKLSGDEEEELKEVLSKVKVDA